MKKKYKQTLYFKNKTTKCAVHNCIFIYFKWIIELFVQLSDFKLSTNIDWLFEKNVYLPDTISTEKKNKKKKTDKFQNKK